MPSSSFALTTGVMFVERYVLLSRWSIRKLLPALGLACWPQEVRLSRPSSPLQEDPEGSERVSKTACEFIQSVVRAEDALLELLNRSRRCEMDTMFPCGKIDVFVEEFKRRMLFAGAEMNDVNDQENSVRMGIRLILTEGDMCK